MIWTQADAIQGNDFLHCNAISDSRFATSGFASAIF
jgi:hypothetical protein